MMFAAGDHLYEHKQAGPVVSKLKQCQIHKLNVVDLISGMIYLPTTSKLTKEIVIDLILFLCKLE